MRTALELATHIKKQLPDCRIGHAKDNAVGYFADGKWWPYALATIDGQWVQVGYVPRINGQDCYYQNDWSEVQS